MRFEHTATVTRETAASGGGFGQDNDPSSSVIYDGKAQVYDSERSVKRLVSGSESPQGIAAVRLASAPDTEVAESDRITCTFNGTTRSGRVIEVSALKSYPRLAVRWE